MNKSQSCPAKCRRKSADIVASVLGFLSENPCSTKAQLNLAVKSGSLLLSSLVKKGEVLESKTKDPTTNRRTTVYSINYDRQQQQTEI